MSSNNKKGIWKNYKIAGLIPKAFQLSLDEGETPVYTISIDGINIDFKDETKNPNQSFKDRSLAFQMSYYNSRGVKNFVISSSGNAARSAIAYANLIPSSVLMVFVSNNIPKYKLGSINKAIGRGQNVNIAQVKRPKSDAIRFATENGATNLRGSVDEKAVVGFSTLGGEIMSIGKQYDAIFICCSSGTSTVGMYAGMKNVYEINPDIKIPAINIVQTTYIHPMAKEFGNDSAYADRFTESESSIANAVADRVAHRKSQVLDVVNQTGGSGWVVSDEEIENAKKKLSLNGIEIEGYNAYVAFAGYLRAVKNEKQYRNPLCILSGI